MAHWFQSLMLISPPFALCQWYGETVFLSLLSRNSTNGYVLWRLLVTCLTVIGGENIWKERAIASGFCETADGSVPKSKVNSFLRFFFKFVCKLFVLRRPKNVTDRSAFVTDKLIFLLLRQVNWGWQVCEWTIKDTQHNQRCVWTTKRTKHS